VSFTVLFVCTGNICRSPMAERLFEARTDPALALRTASAGTGGLTGWGMDGPSALVLRELGGDGAGHSAQRLGRRVLADADLILTAEIEHRDAAIRAEGSARRRAFTLREFGRLGAGLGGLPQPVTAEGLRVRVAEVATRRAAQRPAGPRVDDIADPYGAPLDVVRSCGAQIAMAVDAVIDALGLQRIGTAAPTPPDEPA
jgi:protein-tyrosine phosphatase